MTVKISIDQESNILQVALIGAIDLQEFFSAKQEILRIRGEMNISRILVDATLRQETMGMMDLLSVGQEIASEPMLGMRIAVFSDVPQMGAEFTSKVAAVQHGAEMRTFTCPKAARAWLNSPE